MVQASLQEPQFDLIALKSLLLSTPNAEANPQSKTFLASSNSKELIMLTSYPRSGNTLLRNYLEDISGIFTGSDCDIRRPLNRQLQMMGLSGEGKLDDSVWIAKTHYPERIGRDTCHATKCIVIVRNPLDAIFSLFNMVGTTTHNESLSA